MKSISIMEAQHNLSAWLRVVETGEELAITRRKVVVARLVPPTTPLPLVFPDFQARAEARWGKAWKGSGTTDLVRDSRGDR